MEENGYDNAKAVKELAVQAGELERFEDAIELWKKLIPLSPDDTTIYLNMGYAFLKLGKFQEARDASKKAIELDNTLKEAYLNYSTAELCLGETNKAILSIKGLLKMIPEYPPAMAVLAAAHSVDGNKDKGMDIYNKLRKMGYHCGESNYELSSRLLSAGFDESAARLIEAALESGHTDQRFHELLTVHVKKEGSAS